MYAAFWWDRSPYNCKIWQEVKLCNLKSVFGLWKFADKLLATLMSISKWRPLFVLPIVTAPIRAFLGSSSRRRIKVSSFPHFKIRITGRPVTIQNKNEDEEDKNVQCTVSQLTISFVYYFKEYFVWSFTMCSFSNFTVFHGILNCHP